MCKSRATYRARITCNMSCTTWYEGTAQLLNLTDEIAFIFAFFFGGGGGGEEGLKPLPKKGGEETGVPGENPRRRAYLVQCHRSCCIAIHRVMCNDTDRIVQ